MSALIPVVIIRLLVPITIRRWPFWGGIASFIADTFDLKLLQFLGWPLGPGVEYQSIDKFLDTYYLAFEFSMALKLRPLILRNTLSALFFWRVIGVVILEITHVRKVLFFFPDIFEYLYLLVFWARRYKPSFKLDTAKKIATAVVIIAIPKFFHEYLLHYKEFPFGLGTIWDLFRSWVKL